VTVGHVTGRSSDRKSYTFNVVGCMTIFYRADGVPLLPDLFSRFYDVDKGEVKRAT
jgi:hypothetical protein